MSRLNVAVPKIQRWIAAGPGLASLAALLLLVSVPVAASEPGLGSIELTPIIDDPAPPLPDPGTFPVQLVLDDDVAEGAFGFVGGAARQFLWFNQFADPGPFSLEEIWVLFPNGTDIGVGDSVQLAVFVDPDGDPTNGAQLLGTYDEVVQTVDGTTFSVYPLPTNLLKSTPGDVLIGVVNRYFMTGVDPPPTLPAAFDSTTFQNRSFFALWAGDPPNPPDLDTADSIDSHSGASEGNFMIRGFGTSQAIPVPSQSTAGLAILATLLALAGAALIVRR
ncbi:MAG: hypothetical protein MPN21_19560 [Thermoanaerobaculia bacterium]|nr:hypothetical protein [Thermoanaerobaculia bacterium]